MVWPVLLAAGNRLGRKNTFNSLIASAASGRTWSPTAKIPIAIPSRPIQPTVTPVLLQFASVAAAAAARQQQPTQDRAILQHWKNTDRGTKWNINQMKFRTGFRRTLARDGRKRMQQTRFPPSFMWLKHRRHDRTDWKKCLKYSHVVIPLNKQWSQEDSCIYYTSSWRQHTPTISTKNYSARYIIGVRSQRRLRLN